MKHVCLALLLLLVIAPFATAKNGPEYAQFGRDIRIGPDQQAGDLTCIGCATCANSCPYDNIQMVQIRNQEGKFIVDEQTQTPILKATKCDLCVDQLGGPACVRACPHDALIRADMREVGQLSRWLNR